jgi:CheY-like chemotaxis protein
LYWRTKWPWAIAYAIVTKHQGYITVESTVEVGTTFALYLPAAHSAHAPQADVEAQPGVGMGKILIMDDEAMVRNLAVNMLTRLGYAVESACDGAEAIALYQRAKDAGQPFAAVILDLTVPGGLGGQETIAVLQQLDPQVHAIVSSGYAEDPVMADFRHYGFSGVVTKPYTVQELGNVLQRLLSG